MLGRIDLLALVPHQPMVVLFAVLALGWMLGRVTLGGFSLGPAAVLFAGLSVSALDARLALPEELGYFGLCLFVYSIGVASGPGFVAGLRGRGLAATALTVAGVLLAAGTALGGARLLGVEPAVAVGLFAGGLTNTPALAAAVDTLRAAEGAASAPVVGYSVAYPLGVLLPLVLLTLAARGAPAEEARRDAGLVSRTVRLTRRAGRVDALRAELGGRIGFGRYRRGTQEVVVTDETLLEKGDLVTLVGKSAALAEATTLLGEATHEDIADDHSRVDFRRIFVSRPEVVGRPLSELRLPQRFGALVTRVRRGDVDILADRDTVLELGDRVRVLAPHDRLDEVTQFFGDSYRALAEVDVLSFALGVTLGLMLGLVPIPTPLGEVRLGLAGGPLIVGLLLGRVGRTGPLVWELPFPASMTLRQLGIVLFLAVVGTRSGANLAATLAAGQSGPLFLLGALTTLACAVPVLLLARRALRLPLFQAFGVVAGVHTQPAVLAWAQARTPADGPARGYALVFPAATVTKILVAQVLARLVL